MSNYTTPKAFSDLYYDFTGYVHDGYPKDQTAIAQDLSRVVAAQTTTSAAGPLIIVDSAGVYVYSPETGHPLISSAICRTEPNSGFYEITGVSHVGPSIAYLGALKALGDSSWENHLDPLIEHLCAVRETNSAPIAEHWLTQLDTPIYRERAQQIKNMIDYACSLAANYLLQVKKDKDAFCNQHIVDNFLNIQSNEYPISFDTVMIGTFAVVGLKTVYEIYNALNIDAIDWTNAKVILRNCAGTNYGAGLTEGSNWVVPVIKAIAGPTFDAQRLLILPYVALIDGMGGKTLSEKDYHTIADDEWGATFTRTLVSKMAFSHVEDIKIPYRDPIPGDYELTKSDQIEDFVKRLKFSVTSPKQMLSNTVGYWLAGEAINKKWQFDAMQLPGLTDGFPEGISSYPEDAPAINK